MVAGTEVGSGGACVVAGADVVDGILAHREDPSIIKAFGAHRVYRNTVFEGPPDWDADKTSVMLQLSFCPSAVFGKYNFRAK